MEKLTRWKKPSTINLIGYIGFTSLIIGLFLGFLSLVIWLTFGDLALFTPLFRFSVILILLGLLSNLIAFVYNRLEY
jgi:hypothetical protein